MEKLLKLTLLSLVLSTLSMTSLFSQDDVIVYEARIGNLTPGKIELDEFISQEELNIFKENSNTPGDVIVKSYEMTIVFKDADPIGIVNKGGKFNAASLQQIKRLKKGDTIYFDRILGEIPGGETDIKFASLVFRII